MIGDQAVSIFLPCYTRTIIPEVPYVLSRSSKPIDIRAASWAATNIDRYGDNANTSTPLFFASREPLITAPGSLGFALNVPLDLRGPRTDAGVTLITRGQVHGFAGHVNASLSRTRDPDPARIPMKSKFRQRLTSAATYETLWRFPRRHENASDPNRAR